MAKLMDDVAHSITSKVSSAIKQKKEEVKNTSQKQAQTTQKPTTQKPTVAPVQTNTQRQENRVDNSIGSQVLTKAQQRYVDVKEDLTQKYRNNEIDLDDSRLQTIFKTEASKNKSPYANDKQKAYFEQRKFEEENKVDRAVDFRSKDTEDLYKEYGEERVKKIAMSDVDYDSEIQGIDTRMTELNDFLRNSEDMNANIEASRELTELSGQKKNLTEEKDIRDRFYRNMNDLEYLEYGSDREKSDVADVVNARTDSIGERIVKGTGANALGIIQSGFALFDTIKDVYYEGKADELTQKAIEDLKNGTINQDTYEAMLKNAQEFRDFTVNDERNVSQQLRREVNQLNMEIQEGLSTPEKFVVDSINGTTNFLMQYALFSMIGSLGSGASILSQEGMAVAQKVGEVGSLVSMSSQSGTQKYYELIDEGYDSNTAFLNATATGLISYMTEKIGMDNFVAVMSGKAGQSAFGQIVNSISNGSLKNYYAQSIASGFMAEGLEEVVEGIADPILDAVTLGKPLEYNAGDLFYSFLVGGMSGALMSGAGAIQGSQFVVDTKQQYNALSNDLNVMREIRNDVATEYANAQDEAEAKKIKRELDTIDHYIGMGESALNGFDEKSVVSKGIETAKDQVEPTTKADGDMSLAEAVYPEAVDKSQEIQARNDKMVEAMMNIHDISQEWLLNSGIDVDVNAYMLADAETRADYKTLNEFANSNETRLKVREMLPGQNGMNVTDENGRHEAIVVNTDQRVSLDIDKVADIEDVDFTKDHGNDLFYKAGAKPGAIATAIHELTHFLERTGEWAKIRNFVESSMGKERFAKAVERIGELYSARDIKNANAEAETVAFYVQKYLGNAEFLDRLTSYNTSIASRLFNNLKSTVTGDTMTQLENTFMRAFRKAQATARMQTREAVKSGEETKIGENTVSENKVELSVAQWDTTGREILKTYLENNTDIGESQEILDRVEEMYDRIKEFMDTGKFPEFSKWQNTYYAVNEKGDLSVVINNGEYELNIDFSTVCKKRKMMDKVLNELSRNGYLNGALKPEQLATLRQTIQDHGMEVACGLCFVDSKRFNQGKWAGRFMDKWNGLIDQLVGAMEVDPDTVNTFDFVHGNSDGSKTLADIDFSNPKLKSFTELAKGSSEEAKMAKAIMSDPSLRSYMSTNDMYGSEGFEAIKSTKPELYKLVNASGGASKPKLAHGEINYRNEILFNDKFNEEEARKVGGVRVQSFSDFMTNMVFDYVQMFADMEAKNLPGHSYTKVKEYALLYGKTGMKINLSIIPAAFDSNQYTAEQIADIKKNDKKLYNQLRENAGLDANGNYVFDPESFDFDLAIEIQNLPGYDKNVGTICVGVSDRHIEKLLNDPNVCMVIPYHRSGLSGEIAKQMGISLYNDYTNKQNTRFTKGNGKPGTKVGKQFDFDFYNGSDVNGVHYKGMIENGYDAKATADSYLAWCSENNYTPKFDTFKDNPNYYKLLIDFRAYDKNGNIAPQESIKVSGENSFANANDVIDPKKFPKLAELYGDNVSFNNVLENGLRDFEEINAKQNEELGKITSEVIQKLGLKKNDTGSFSFSLSAVSTPVMLSHGIDLDARVTGEVVGDSDRYSSVGRLNPSQIARDSYNNIVKKYGRNNITIRSNAQVVIVKEDDLKHDLGWINKFDNQEKMEYSRANAFAIEHIDKVIENAHKINQLRPSKGHRNGQDVYLSVIYDTDGNAYYERFTVDRFSNVANAFSLIGKLYAVNSLKKENAYPKRTAIGNVLFNNSLKELANEVKGKFADTLPQNILDELKMVRPVTDISKNVMFSLTLDSNGRSLTPQQQEYFKDSKMVDDDGNLIVMYHGTSYGGFSVFDPSFSDDGISLFFTNNPDMAGSYIYESDVSADFDRPLEEYRNNRIVPGEQRQKGLYEVYLNLKNPLIIDAEGKEWYEVPSFMFTDKAKKYNNFQTIDDYIKFADDYGLTLYGYDNADLLREELEGYDSIDKPQDFAEILTGIFNEDTSDIIEDFISSIGDDSYATPRDWSAYAKENGYDGVIIKDVIDYSTGIADEYKPSTIGIAFDSNQVKSVNNTNPTSNNDIRYSLTLDLTDEQREEVERIKAKNRQSHSKKDALLLRDAGEKLSESDFYKVYNAHKLNMRRISDDAVDEIIAKIKDGGFKGDAGFGINVMPATLHNGVTEWNRESYTNAQRDLARQYGLDESRAESSWDRFVQNPPEGGIFIDGAWYKTNYAQLKYGARKGEKVLLVPSSWVVNDEKVKNGFIPFDYEVVQVERNFQPYYELYSKAYDKAHGETSFSLTIDRDYTQAVESGDMETAQRMVDEEAKKNGYNVRVYHTSSIDTPFNEFDQSVSVVSLNKPGWSWFSPNEEYTKNFGDGKTYEGYIKVKNPLDLGNIERKAAIVKQDSYGNVTDVEFTPAFEELAEKVNMTAEDLYGLVNEDYGGDREYMDNEAISEVYNDYRSRKTTLPLYAFTRSGAFREAVQREGYDSVKAKEGKSHVVSYGIPSSSQFKSADPVTYDDDGNVIPLSERFNDESNDIRYSLTLDDARKKADDNNLRNNYGMFYTNLFGSMNVKISDESNAVLYNAVNEAYENGTVSEETRRELYKTILEETKEEIPVETPFDGEAMRKYLRSNKINIDSLMKTALRGDKHSKGGYGDFGGAKDWDSYRRSTAKYFDYRRNGGLPVDTVFQEFAELYPGSVDPTIFGAKDQLDAMIEAVENNMPRTETRYDTSYGEDQFYEWADETIDKMVEDVQKTKDFREKMDSGELKVTDEDLDKIVRRNPISARTMQAMEDNERIFRENAKSWIPDYDIIREKYDVFSEDVLNDAMYETLMYGHAEPETVEAMTKELVDRLDNVDWRVAERLTNDVNEAVEDMLHYFALDFQYKANQKNIDPVVTRVNNVVKAFDEATDIDAEIGMQKEIVDSLKEAEEFKKNQGDTDLAAMLIKRGVDQKTYTWRTLEQNLDYVANGDMELRNRLKEDLELPRSEAQLRRNEIRNQAQEIINKAKELGITAGSDESKIAQFYKEGHTNERDTIDTSTQEGIDRKRSNPWKEYTKEQFDTDTNYKMKNGKTAKENIKKVVEMIDDSYNNLILALNMSQTEIYGDVIGQNEYETAQLKAKLEKQSRVVEILKEEMKDTDSVEKQGAYNKAVKEYNKLINQLNTKLENDASNDSTRRRFTPLRRNYAHHITKSSLVNDIKGIVKGRDAIPTALNGLSENTLPNTAAAGFMWAQEGGDYIPDLIESYANYVDEASKVLAYNDYIVKLRQVTKDLRATATGNEMSRFTDYLEQYANDIAGKRRAIDRAVDKAMPSIGQAIRVANRLGKRAALMFNVNSALVQVANIPNGLGILYREGGKSYGTDVVKGISDMLNSNREDMKSIMEKSAFMNDRYFDFKTYDNSLKAKIGNLADIMMTAGDKFGANVIWWSAYEQAIRKGMKPGGSEAIFYADDITRRTTAGRGVGEVPLGLRSNVLNTIAPFQVENNNSWQTFKQNVKGKQLGALVTAGVFSYLLNMLFRFLKRDDVLPEALSPVIDQLFSDEDATIDEKLSNIVLGEIGEILSAIPGGSFITSLSMGKDKADEVFGDYNPSRYGITNIGLTGVGNAFYDATVKNDGLAALTDLFEGYFPGGKQISRTIEGLQSYGVFPQYKDESGRGVLDLRNNWKRSARDYDKNGNIKFENDPDDFWGALQAALFGKWASKSAQEYVDNGFHPYGKAATNISELLDEMGQSTYTKMFSGNITGENSQKFVDKLNEMGIYDEYLDKVNEKYDEYLDTVPEGEKPVTFNKFANDYGLTKAVMDGTYEPKESVQTTEEPTKEESNFDFFSFLNREKEEISDLYSEKADASAEEKEEIQEEIDKKQRNLQNNVYSNYTSSRKMDDKTAESFQSAMDLDGVYKDPNGNISDDRTSDSKKVRNSEAIETRKALEDMGEYENVLDYIAQYGLEYSDFGLSKTVVGWDDAKFDSKYSEMFGGTANGNANSNANRNTQRTTNGGARASGSRRSSGRRSSRSTTESDFARHSSAVLSRTRNNRYSKTMSLLTELDNARKRNTTPNYKSFLKKRG